MASITLKEYLISILSAIQLIFVSVIMAASLVRQKSRRFDVTSLAGVILSSLKQRLSHQRFCAPSASIYRLVELLAYIQHKFSIKLTT